MNRIDQEMMQAAQKNNLPDVSRLLIVGADVNAKDNDGRTPLSWACKEGHVQVVIELLQHGADVNAKDNDDWTPLHWASLRGHVQVFQALLDHGADVEVKDCHDCTPLHWACCNSEAVLNELVSRGASTEVKIIEGRLLFTGPALVAVCPL
jgi:ankyrin repeat protein